MFNFLQQQQGQNNVEITHHTFIDLLFTWIWSLSLIIGGNICVLSFFQDGLKAVESLKPSVEQLATDLTSVSRCLMFEKQKA